MGISKRIQKYPLICRWFETIPINNEIAEAAAVLREKYNLLTPDAIQIAAAIHSGAKFFLTKDLKLKNVSDINILYLNNLF